MIDLHLHTTASDGRSTPEGLVREAHAAGVRTMAVTDHDTLAAVARVKAAATALGMAFVPGIEMTAVESGRDVHVLGYFLDPADTVLNAFLDDQRQNRVRRVQEIGERLLRLGIDVNVETLISAAADMPGKAVGRPLIAAALVAAGHADSVADAFSRYLSEGRPAYVARHGVPAKDVIAHIRAAGGISSMAHPGKVKRDHLIPAMVAAGLDALEVFHPDHGADDVVRYETLARTLDVAMTGGSDYHGPGSGRTGGLGHVGLPVAAYGALLDRVARVHP